MPRQWDIQGREGEPWSHSVRMLKRIIKYSLKWGLDLTHPHLWWMPSLPVYRVIFPPSVQKTGWPKEAYSCIHNGGWSAPLAGRRLSSFSISRLKSSLSEELIFRGDKYTLEPARLLNRNCISWMQMKHTNFLLSVSQIQLSLGNGLDQGVQEKGDGGENCLEMFKGLWLQAARGH